LCSSSFCYPGGNRSASLHLLTTTLELSGAPRALLFLLPTGVLKRRASALPLSFRFRLVMYTRYENLERMRLCNVIYDQLYRTRDLTSPRKRVQYGSISESSSELHVLFSFQVSDCFKLSRQPFLILVPRLPFFHAI